MAASCSKNEKPQDQTGRESPNVISISNEPQIMLVTNVTDKILEPAKYRTIWDTNQAGLVESAKVLDDSGKMKRTETYSYDTSTNLLRKQRVTSDGRIFFFPYSYGADGQ